MARTVKKTNVQNKKKTTRMNFKITEKSTEQKNSFERKRTVFYVTVA